MDPHRRLLAFAFLALLTGCAPWTPPISGGSPRGPEPRDAHGEEEEEGGPTEWFGMQRAFPHGRIDNAARRASVAAARRMRASGRAPGIWSLVGPFNVGGRVSDVVGDPADPARVYCAAASGGIWKTTDAGASWLQVFDGAGSPSIGALALHPTDFDTLYAGTGEANPGGGSLAYGGDGVWKTTDGGATWSSLGLADTVSIGRIAVDPTDPSRIFVAATGNLYAADTNRGVYRSTDSGSSWQQVLFVDGRTGAVDLAIDPVSPQNVYAATWERLRAPSTRKYGGPGSGVHRSTDGGTTWSLLTNGLPASSTEPGRIGIALSPAAPSHLFALYADTVGYFSGFYSSTDGGTSFTRQPDGNLSGFYSSYGWWFGRLVADPVTVDRLWALGFDMYATSNGGASWSFAAGSMHVDHHALWIGGGVYWQGNDGGLHRSTSGTGAWSHEDDLPITQFYTTDVHATRLLQPFGGAQDNGMLHSFGGLPDDWVDVYGGDGLWVVVDPGNADVVYAESQYGALGKSTNGGNTFVDATNGITGRTNWSTPVVMDPSGGGQVLYYGAERLFRTTNGGVSWSANSPDLSDGNPGSNGVVYGTITAIAPAPSDPATVYAGTDDANVWRTTDAGGSWIRVDAAIPERWVTRIAVDPGDAAVAYVTLSGYRDADAAAHVYRTTDGGATWAGASGNLPDAPVNDFVIDAATPGTLYLASDVGVFTSTDSGASWAALGTGLPEVVAMDLRLVDGPTRWLYVGTYGRGMYRLDLSLPLPDPGDFLVGAGLGQPNPNRVRSYDATGAPGSADFLAYLAGKWGVNVAAGDIDGAAPDEIVTGPGPGDVFGPHVRGFAAGGTPMKISYFAYGTLRYGVNVAAGSFAAGAEEEIVTGAGPGTVFGPHVRGWSWNGTAIAPLPSFNYFAYFTLRYGANVSGSDVDDDGFHEVLTGPGPGAVFGPLVRGWDYDGAAIAPIAGLAFNAFSLPQYGAVVAGGLLDDDAAGEITAAGGAGPGVPATIRGFDWDGGPVASLPGYEVTPFLTSYGAHPGAGELTGDPRHELIAGAGPDPAAASTVVAYDYAAGALVPLPVSFDPFPGTGYGVCVAGAKLAP